MAMSRARLVLFLSLVAGLSVHSVCRAGPLARDKQADIDESKFLSQGGLLLETGRMWLPGVVRGTLTWDHCETDDGCQEPRKCVSTVDDDDEGVPCDDEEICRCWDDNAGTCTKSLECDNGEACAVTSDSFSTIGRCISEFSAEDVGMKPVFGGLTLDDCTEDEDCEGSRICRMLDRDDDLVDCDGDSDSDCFCRNLLSVQTCLAHDDCDFGERCFKVADRQQCISEAHNNKTQDYDPIRGGLTLDDCRSKKGCENTPCLKWLSDISDFQLCLGRDDCRCQEEEHVECSTDEDCIVEGEACARDTESGDIYCVSKAFLELSNFLEPVGSSTPATPSSSPTSSPIPEVSQSPTPSSDPSPTPSPTSSAGGISPSPSRTPFVTVPDGICVDAEALAHLEPSELVYTAHRRARVLCDPNGSCATPGHMILFKGERMMMKTYCTVTGCDEQIMYVNSPKYKKRLKVGSKTKGLFYTTFAARYETRGEEYLLATLIRLGF